MSLQMITAAAQSGGSSVNPYVVGAVALGILLALMGILLAVGAGREHS